MWEVALDSETVGDLYHGRIAPIEAAAYHRHRQIHGN